MPDPDKQFTDAEDEMDALLEKVDASESLGTAPVPPQPRFDQPDPSVGDKELDELLSVAVEAPEAQMTVGEPEVIKTAGAPQPPPSQPSWYESLLRGAGQGVTAGFGDELSSVLTPSSDDGTGIPRTYAAGSASQDLRNTMRAENEEAAAANPVSSAAGNILGSIPGAIATGGGGLATQTGSAALNLAANNIGRGEGSLQDRLDQSDETIKEHPLQTGIALAAPAAARGLGSLLKKTGANATTAGDKLRTHSFMTPAQRSAYEASKGKGSLAKLGKDAGEAGLYKSRGFMDWFKPVNASRVSDNAAGLRASSGKEIGALRNEFTSAGVNPTIPIDDMVSELRGMGTTASKRTDPLSKVAGARTFNKFADNLGFEDVGGQAPAIKADPITAFREIDAPTRPGGGQLIPRPEGGFVGTTGRRTIVEPVPAELVHEGTIPYAGKVSRSSMPLKEVFADMQDLGGNIDWGRNKLTTEAPAAEVARKFLYGGYKDKVGKALVAEAEAGRIAPEKVAAYTKANKDFSTAAAVSDPALKMAERNEQAGLSLKDLVVGAATGNPFASVVSRGMQGSGGAVGARGAYATGGLASGAGKILSGVASAPGALAGAIAPSPIQKASQEQPGAPKSVVETTANTDLKEQILKAGQKASNWYKRWVK